MTPKARRFKAVLLSLKRCKKIKSYYEIADQANMTRQAISEINGGRRSIPGYLIEILADKYAVNPEFLSNGTGHQFIVPDLR